MSGERLSVLAALAMGAAVSTACVDYHEGVCDDLVGLAMSVTVQESVIDWVDSNLLGVDVYGLPLAGGGGRWPGQYELNMPFDWSVLSMTEDPGVRIVIDYHADGSGKLNSVFFGEMSGYGLLVLSADAEEFDIRPSALRSITERIAVVCEARD